MKYFLSNIADISMGESAEEVVYSNVSASVAMKYGLGLELAEFCVTDNLDTEYDDLISRFECNRNIGIPVLVHGPYSELFPHALDKRICRVAAERYEQIWNICRQYNIDKLILHANYIPGIYFPEWFIEKQTLFWNNFLKRHNEKITVCLENVREPYPSLITDIVENVSDIRLKMCLDVGHANLTETGLLKWIEESAPYVSHYHIHNNEGTSAVRCGAPVDMHRGLDMGIIDMKSILDLAEKLTPDATVTVETTDIENSAKWLRKNGYV